MARLIQLACVVLAIIGIVKLVGERQTLTSLRAEHHTLVAKYGELDVRDADKFLVAKIDTGDPKHFLWRVYQPANDGINYRHNTGFGGRTSGGSGQIDAGQQVVQCRFRLDNGQLETFTMSPPGSGMFSSGDRNLRDFLDQYWDQLLIEQLGSDGVVEVPADEAMVFLTIRVPPRLLPEVPEQYRQELTTKPIFEMIRGTDEGMAAYDQAQSGATP